jgi:hypothetical protein
LTEKKPKIDRKSYGKWQNLTAKICLRAQKNPSQLREGTQKNIPAEVIPAGLSFIYIFLRLSRSLRGEITGLIDTFYITLSIFRAAIYTAAACKDGQKNLLFLSLYTS